MARDRDILIVMQSHLSDGLMEIGFNPEMAAKRIRFVKRLLNLDDTKRLTDEELDELWNEVNPA